MLEEAFSITVKVDKPILVGQDEVVGRRQLILQEKICMEKFYQEELIAK